jgi:hypothetical protein
MKHRRKVCQGRTVRVTNGNGYCEGAKRQRLDSPEGCVRMEAENPAK